MPLSKCRNTGGARDGKKDRLPLGSIAESKKAMQEGYKAIELFESVKNGKYFKYAIYTFWKLAL